MKKRTMMRWKTVLIGMLVCLSPTAFATEQKEFSRWQVDVQGDQQESIGYDVSLSYRLPKKFFAPGSGLLLMVPGMYFNLGVGERVFAQNAATRVDSRTGRSWNYGFAMKLPMSELLYLQQKARVVRLRLPDSASQRYLSYAETTFGLGVGSAQGAFLEFGTNIRVMSKFEKPITVGNTVIQQQAMIYPSMSLGYRL